jgi:O-antigen/teichoic acid export membrane protein
VANLQENLKKLFSLSNKSGFLYLLSANFLIQISGFGGQIFLTRILPVEDIGTIKVLQSYMSIFVVIASLGLNTAVLKICSEDIERKRKKVIFNFSLWTTIIASISLIFIIILLMSFTNIKIDRLMFIYIYLIPLISLTNLLIVFLQSQQMIKTMSIIQSVSKIFIIIFSTLFAYTLGLNGYVYSLVILNFIAFLAMIPVIKEYLDIKIFDNISRNIIKRIFKISNFALGANLLGVLLVNVNVIIANNLLVDKAEIGYFSIAQLIVNAMMMLPITLGQIMAPKISKVSDDILSVKKVLKIYQKRNAVLAILVALIASITAPFIIPLVFGEIYTEAVKYFEILLLGFVFWSFFSPKGITLMSIGRSDINFYVSLISIIINIVLNFYLIKMLGMLGASVATTLTYFITIFINSYFLNKYYQK